jgi:hypothetical protein
MMGGDVLAATFATCQRVSGGFWNDVTLRLPNGGFFFCFGFLNIKVVFLAYFLYFTFSSFSHFSFLSSVVFPLSPVIFPSRIRIPVSSFFLVFVCFSLLHIFSTGFS